MRKSLLLGFASLVAVEAVATELVITSFNANGELTWTNSVSNATYRVEWAGSATGPWNNFDSLTNLTLLSATNNSVTVKVPTFYRVVWTDAPPYAGIYDFREYDLDGSLVVTGRLYLSGSGGSIKGTKDLRPAGNYSTNDVGPQLGAGTLGGGFAGMSAWPYMTLGLNPGFIDNNVTLSGWLVGDTYLGSWGWYGFTASPLVLGTFAAVKQNAAGNSPPPNASGSWQYMGYELESQIVVTGQLSFAISTNPVTGSWLFNKLVPSVATGHEEGQGIFTNAVVSGNNLKIVISQTSENSFSLDGQISDDFYAGFWQRLGLPGPEKGTFVARRKNAP